MRFQDAEEYEGLQDAVNLISEYAHENAYFSYDELVDEASEQDIDNMDDVVDMLEQEEIMRPLDIEERIYSGVRLKRGKLKRFID